MILINEISFKQFQDLIQFLLIFLSELMLLSFDLDVFFAAGT